MRMFLMFVLLASCLGAADAESISKITLRDGRVLEGVYDEASGRIAIGAGSLAVPKDQIVSIEVGKASPTPEKTRRKYTPLDAARARVEEIKGELDSNLRMQKGLESDEMAAQKRLTYARTEPEKQQIIASSEKRADRADTLRKRENDIRIRLAEAETELQKLQEAAESTADSTAKENTERERRELLDRIVLDVSLLPDLPNIQKLPTSEIVRLLRERDADVTKQIAELEQKRQDILKTQAKVIDSIHLKALAMADLADVPWTELDGENAGIRNERKRITLRLNSALADLRAYQSGRMQSPSAPFGSLKNDLNSMELLEKAKPQLANLIKSLP